MSKTATRPDLAALASRVVDFLRTELGVDEPGLGAATPLVSNGLVDSAGLMRLAAFLERQTDVRIPDQDVTVVHFDTIDRMIAYLRGRLGT